MRNELTIQKEQLHVLSNFQTKLEGAKAHEGDQVGNGPNNLSSLGTAWTIITG